MMQIGSQPEREARNPGEGAVGAVGANVTLRLRLGGRSFSGRRPPLFRPQPRGTPLSTQQEAAPPRGHAQPPAQQGCSVSAAAAGLGALPSALLQDGCRLAPGRPARFRRGQEVGVPEAGPRSRALIGQRPGRPRRASLVSCGGLRRGRDGLLAGQWRPPARR